MVPDALVESAPATVPEQPCSRSHGRLDCGVAVGRYALVDRLGAGAMGEVYAALDTELERRVALKFIKRRRARPSPNDRARLLREAQALARLSHPNVVPVYDVGVWEGRMFVAMELVRGRTLRKWASMARRPWPTIVRVMLEAGRGLQAAHAAGLVHRDFKPDNVLIDDDGRVRVMDFGLARGLEGEPDRCPTLVDGSDGLTETLTRTGSVMGTPSYMSPEQHAGRRVDARSDQYSFAITLFELLYGRRPFTGATIKELSRRKWLSRIRYPDRERSVPRWLRRVIDRALLPHPEERWPSMTAMLEALERAVAPAARWSWLAGCGVTLTLGGLSVALAAPASPCDNGADRVAAVWHAARKDDLREAFVQTGRPYAASTFGKVERWVDEYTDAWEGLHANTCHAAHELQELDDDEHDQRMACLDDGLQRLDAVLGVLERGDAGALDHAVAAAAALGTPAECRVRGSTTTRAPVDPQQADRRRGVRERLARAYALDAAGLYHDGLVAATRAVQDVEATGDAVLQAEARLRLGHLHQRLRHLERAEQELGRAVWLAESEGQDAVAARAATHLVWLVGDLQDRPNAGLAWARHARSLVTRAGDDPLARAHLLENEANVLVDLDEHQAALRKLARAIELREAHQPPRHPALAMAYNNYGTALSAAGRHDQARVQLRRAASLHRAALGPEHPNVAIALTNIAGQLIRAGHYTEAEAELERAHEIFEGSVGPEHPNTAEALNGLAVCRYRQRDPEGAAALLLRVVEIRERALGPEHPEVAHALGSLGGVLAELERHDEARQVLRRAIDKLEAHHGEDHPSVAGSLVNLGEVERLSGHPDRAHEHLERALSLWEQSLGPGHPNLVFALHNLGKVELELGRSAQVIALAERALDLPGEARTNAILRAELEFLLARGLWQSGGAPARARRLAEQASATLAARPERAERQVEIRRWLRRHPTTS